MTHSNIFFALIHLLEILLSYEQPVFYWVSLAFIWKMLNLKGCLHLFAIEESKWKKENYLKEKS